MPGGCLDCHLHLHKQGRCVPVGIERRYGGMVSTITGKSARAVAAFHMVNNLGAQVIPQLIEVKIVCSCCYCSPHHVGSAIGDRENNAVLVGHVADLKEPNNFAYP